MNNKNLLIGVVLIFLEVILLFSLFSFTSQEVLADMGNPAESLVNVTIGNSYPEIYNMSINDDIAVALIPNATKLVSCTGIILDWNGDTDIHSSNATLFDSSISQSDPNDNNNHYTNSSCNISINYGTYKGEADDSYKALVNCTFQVYYYANPGSWNCTIQANDTAGGVGIKETQGTISQLLALGLPDIVQYGEVNATAVSAEQEINITNYGNIKVNLSLEGYGHTPGDGNAMNCTLGGIKNISVENEKFNLTTSNSGAQTLAQFEVNYTNLTSSAVTKQFNLTSRIDDASEDTIKPTYWRIYVPTGVAGTCQGNIVFGATTASE